MTVIPTMLHILAGIAIFAGLYHIIVAVRGVDRKTHLTFGMSVLAAVVYTLSSAYLYTAQNAETYLQAVRIQMFCSAFFFVLYCWFIAYYSKITIKPFLVIITISYAAIPFIRLFSPTTMVYNDIVGIRTVLLPWGEQINTIQAGLSGFGYFYFTFICIIILYPLLIGFKLLQKNEKRKGIIIVICQFFLISTVCIDIVIDIFQLQWFYSGEIGILSLIVLMSYKLSDDQFNTVIMKAKLAESEEKYCKLFESSPYSIATINLGGIITDCNEKTVDMLGFSSKDEITGKCAYDFVLPEERAIARANFTKRVYKSYTGDSEYTFLKKNGTHFPVKLSAGVIQNARREPVSLVAIVEDNTVRKQYEDEIRAERDKLKAIFDGLSKGGIGIDIISRDFKILFQNSVLKERFAHIFGKNCYSKYMNRTSPCDPCPVQNAITSQKAVDAELTGSDGRIYHLISVPLTSPDGTIDKAIEVIIDVTEQKESEVKRRLIEERFSQIAENIEEIFFLMDKSTHSILYISPMCEPVLGVPPEKLLDKEQSFFNLIHPDDRTGMTFLDNELRYTATHNEEFRIIRPDRTIRWLRLKAFPIIDRQQNSFRTAGVISDVTDFKIAQEQSNMQQQQLIQADKLASIGLMVSGVAHEINNPNNLIMMNGGVLKTFWEQIRQFLQNKSVTYAIKEIAGMSVELTCKEFERMINGILSGSNRIQTIVRDLQNFTRDEPETKSHNISIENALQTSYSLVRNLIKKSTNHFNFNNSTNIPLLYGNMQKLEQVIVNMLTNACQAMTSKEDSITLTSSYNEDDDEISIIVEDTGMGISEDILTKIMDPFFTTKRETGGTGLGLSVSYGIIKDHGGHIKVESQKGKGTKFTIILPTGQRKNNVSSYTVSQIIS